MVVTRFPPSPTGDLHIGSVRTALYSWLYARRHAGKMVLRIEDTDQERSTPEAVAVILEGLKWLDLDWDEGPFYQTKRFDRYRSVVMDLIDQGVAYRCTCSKARLESLRAEQMANQQKPKYDGHCRDRRIGADTQESFVVRFKTPQTGQLVLQDLVKGAVTFDNQELDDLIIERSDRTPTYQLGVVVDDWDMKITHVIRGDDHLSNTPRQIHILNALKAPLPAYAHIPMILGSDGKRLSKRHGAVSVLQYREEGFLKEALLNYLVRLGWSHGDQEIFSREEMIAHFDLEHIQRSSAAFNLEKLFWLNQHYLKTLPMSELIERWIPYLEEQGVPFNKETLPAVAHLLRERAKTLKEMASMSAYFFGTELNYDEKTTQLLLNRDSAAILEALKQAFAQIEGWQAVAIQTVIKALCEERSLGFGKIAQPLRGALTGQAVSPPMAETMEVLGQELTLARLEKALLFIKNGLNDLTGEG